MLASGAVTQRWESQNNDMKIWQLAPSTGYIDNRINYASYAAGNLALKQETEYDIRINDLHYVFKQSHHAKRI